MSEDKPKLRLVEWRAIERNTLRGFATVEFPFGLRIVDISVHRQGDRAWCAMPGKPQVERDGSRRRDEGGKIKYVQIVGWRDRELADRFSRAVLALIESDHPGATS